MKILLIHGPNFNLLGTREPEIYGTDTLAEINVEIAAYGRDNGIEIHTAQSNSEGAIIDLLHDAMNWANGIIINPAAYTHYSYAIYDALLAVGVPTIEVHLSDIHRREDFRAHSVIAPACIKQITGHGKDGYLMAIDHLSQYLS